MELTEHFLRPPLLWMRFYGSTKKPVPFRKQQELVSIKKSQRDKMQLTLLLTVSLNISHSWFLPMMFCVCSIQKVVPLCFNLLDVKFLIWSIVRFNFSTTILRGIAS